MATLTRSKIKTDKNGAQYRLYAVLCPGLRDLQRFERGINSAGFELYHVSNYTTRKNAAGVRAAVWKMPAKPLLDRLIKAAYNAIVGAMVKPGRNQVVLPHTRQRQTFINQLQAQWQGGNGKPARYWRVRARDL